MSKRRRQPWVAPRNGGYSPAPLFEPEQIYPKKPRKRGLDDSSRPWRVEYELAYDGGGGRWTGYYNSEDSARFFAWVEVKIKSWGGSAVLYKND